MIIKIANNIVSIYYEIMLLIPSNSIILKKKELNENKKHRS